MSEKKSFADTVAERIITQLSNGTAPWTRPWAPGQYSRPFNPATGKAYRGINALFLSMDDFKDPRWLTFKQAEENGWRIRKGSKGTPIQFWRFYEEPKAGESPDQPLIKLDRPQVFTAVVFNAEQVDGTPSYEPVKIQWTANERAESILLASGADIRHEDGDQAFYRVSTDSIHLPSLVQFPSAEDYYQVALHELGHWTGHESRLNRNLQGEFGSTEYAKEELRAEIASFMLNTEIGLGHNPSRHFAYIQSWIKVLRNDPTEIFRAARDAENIRNLVLDIELQQTAELETRPQKQLISGVNVLYQFAGKRSMTAPLESLQRAKELSDRKLSMEAIRQQTNWFKGLDEKWRYEISDHEAKLINPPIEKDFSAFRKDRLESIFGEKHNYLNLTYEEQERYRFIDSGLLDEYETSNGSRRLDEFLDHPSLFAAYPHLRDMMVVPREEFGGRGCIFTNAQQIHVKIGSEKQMLSTIMHEIQHEIQFHENFAIGGNTNEEFIRNIKDTLKARVDHIENKIHWWKESYQHYLDDAEEKAKLALHSLMYHSADTLLQYAGRERLTNIYRHIRNEFQWMSSEHFRNDSKAKELNRQWHDIPPKHQSHERNEFLRKMCVEVAGMLRKKIPEDILHTLESDPRQLKNLVSALRKKAQQAREKIKPLLEMENKLLLSATAYELNRFSRGFEIYEALAGEVESRNTQKRLQLDDEERRMTPPILTMDIKREKVIVMFGAADIAAETILQPSLSLSQVQTIASRFRSDIQHPVDIHVAESIATMPDYIRKQIAADSSDPNRIKALAFGDSEVWLNASAMYSEEDVERALFHEVYGHIGISNLFGDKCQIALHNLFYLVGGESGLRRLMKNRDIDFESYKTQAQSLNLDPYHRDCLMTAECLAVIAENNKPSLMNAIKEVIGAMLLWLRDKGFRCLPTFSEPEVLYLLKSAKNTLTTGFIPETHYTHFLTRDMTFDDDMELSVTSSMELHL